jgi:hypothetical protein
MELRDTREWDKAGTDMYCILVRNRRKIMFSKRRPTWAWAQDSDIFANKKLLPLSFVFIRNLSPVLVLCKEQDVSIGPSLYDS